MKKYIKEYMKDRGFSVGDFIPCEICGEQANNIHHKEHKQMGGKKPDIDNPHNLIALCNKHHAEAHGIKLLSNL